MKTLKPLKNLKWRDKTKNGANMKGLIEPLQRPQKMEVKRVKMVEGLGTNTLKNVEKEVRDQEVIYQRLQRSKILQLLIHQGEKNSKNNLTLQK